MVTFQTLLILSSVWTILASLAFGAPPASRPAGPYAFVGSVDGFADSDGRSPFIGDRNRFVTRYADGVRVWTLNPLRFATPKFVHRDLNFFVTGRDGKSVLTASDQELRVWDVARGKVTFSVKLAEQHLLPMRVCSADLSPDGRFVSAVFTGGDFSVMTWRRPNPVAAWRVADEIASTVQFDPTGKWVVTHSEPAHQFHLRVAETGKQRFPPIQSDDDSSRPGASFDPTGHRLLIPDPRDIEIVDTLTGKLVMRIKLQDHVQSATFSGNGSEVIVTTWSDTESVKVYDAANGQLRFSIPGDFSSCEADKSFHWAACPRSATSKGKVVEIWDLVKQARVQELPFTGVVEVHMSSDGSTLLISHYGGDTDVWQRLP